MFQNRTQNERFRIDTRSKIGYHIKYQEHIKTINRVVHI